MKMYKSGIIKTLTISGHFIFMMLLLLSAFYYKERILFFDNVYYLFKIIYFERFNIEAGRCGAFISQIPVIIGLKAGLSLKSLMFIYSISFILLYYTVYNICVHVLKNIVAGFSIIFIIILCMRQSFFHPTHESHQALAYALLFYAIINYTYRSKYKYLKYLLAGLISALCFFTYPAIVFPLLFILTFYIINNSKWKEKGIYWLVIFLILISAFEVIHTSRSSYEGQFLSGLFNFKHGNDNFFEYYSLKFFRKKIEGLYFWLCIIFILSIILQLARKNYLKAGFTFTASIGFFILLIYTYRTGDSDVMMERSFLPLSVFVTIPFFNEMIELKRKILVFPSILLIIIILFTGLRRISLEGQRFKGRIKKIEQILEKTQDIDGSKFLLKKSDENIRSIIMPWTFPFTTLMVSSMDGKKNTKTIYLYDDINDYKKYLDNDNDVFLGASFWLEWNTKTLNPKYFNLPSETYKVLN